MNVSEGKPSAAVSSSTAPPPLSLRTNAIATLMGSVVYSACQWAMLVAIARLGNADMVGEFALGIAISAPVLSLCNLNLRAVQATDANRDYPFRTYFTLRILTSVLAFTVIATLGWLFADRPEARWVVLAVGATKSLESLGDVQHGLFQQRERLDFVGTSLALRGIAGVTLLGGTMLATHEVLWGVVAAGLGSALVLVGFDASKTLQAAGTEGLAAPPDLARQMVALVRLALPLGAVMLLLTLNASVPRLLLEVRRGPKELGIFAALAYLFVAGDLVMNSLCQSASPRLATHFASRDGRAFLRLLRHLVTAAVLLGGTGVLLVSLLGRSVVQIVYGPDYVGQTHVLLVLMIASLCSYMSGIFGTAVTSMRAFAVQMPVNLLSVCVTVSVGYVAINRLGAAGAAYALLASASTNAVVFAFVALAVFRSSSEAKAS